MLQRAIEEKREMMKNLVNQYGITAEVTISCSQELDKLLNRVLLEQLEANNNYQQKKGLSLKSTDYIEYKG